VIRESAALQQGEHRLNLVGSTNVHDYRTEIPQHPLHRMFMDKELEEKLSRLTYRAFGQILCINRYVFQIDLRMGQPTLPLTLPPASQELLDQYMALPLVSNQGDGVKSFVGLLLHTIIPDQTVLLIDEPEAFLHPPQARLMGRILANDTPPASQIIVATHSQDFLQGVLESPARKIKLIRLSRNPDGSAATLALEPDRVRELWSYAQIRYSNLLDGLFHSGVVVCESDADCQFYEATLDLILDFILANSSDHDLLFTHVGGKARLPKALRELGTFGVRRATRLSQF
jgi:hypothetical protein